MNRSLTISTLILALAGFGEAIQPVENHFQFPAGTPDLLSITGVTSEAAVVWKPIVDGKTPTVWNAWLAEKSLFLATSTGAPIPFSQDLTDEHSLARSSERFVLENRDILGCNECQPRLYEVRNSEKFTTITLEIAIDEIKIEGASVILVVNRRGELISVKATTFGSEVESEFILSSSAASAIAINSLDIPCSINSIEPILLPRTVTENRILLHSAFKVVMNSLNPAFQPTIYVSAGNGSTLAAENRVNFVQVEGATSGSIYPEYGRQQLQGRQFPYETIQVENETDFSDEEGLFAFEIAEENAPFQTSGALVGRWVEVQEFVDTNAAFEQNFAVDEFVDVNWNEENSSADERNLYYHVNVIHDHFKQIEPNFEGMDFVILAVCGVGGAGYEQLEDNAFSNGPEIYFGRGRQADNFAHYCDVIYHEYGHSVTGQVYGNRPLPYEGESGAMNEGWSDYFTCSFTDEPRIGEGGLLGNGIIRNIDNNLFYPRDLRGEVHDDSRMFSASMWHTREILGRRYSDSLFHFTRYLYANDFREYLLDVLLTDDDDGDLTNGSPNYRTIYEQFARHGIGLVDVSHFQIARLTVSDDGDENGNNANNGFYEPYGIVSIEMDIFRAGAPIPLNNDSIYVLLETDSPDIQVLRGRTTISSLAPGEVGSITESLVARISSDAPLSFANLIFTVGASQDETPLVDTLRIPLGHPDILLVRDGTTEIDRTPWFHRALDQLEHVYYDLNTTDPSYPLEQMLPSFESVIWFTGDERENVMTPGSVQLLENHLDNGGRLILTGQYISSWNESEAFLSERLGARFVSDTLMLSYLEGVEGDPVGDSTRLLLLGGDGARNQGRPGIVEPVNRGIVTHRWTRAEGRPAGAIRRSDPVTNARTIFYAFGLESVGGAGPTSKLKDVLKKSLDWLASEEAVETNPSVVVEFHLDPSYPNPFNGWTTIRYSLPSALNIQVEVFDLTGRQTTNLVSGHQGAGDHQIVWQPTNQPSGLYYVQLKSGEMIERRSLLLLK